jgi:hypothetical protein
MMTSRIWVLKSWMTMFVLAFANGELFETNRSDVGLSATIWPINLSIRAAAVDALAPSVYPRSLFFDTAQCE